MELVILGVIAIVYTLIALLVAWALGRLGTDGFIGILAATFWPLSLAAVVFVAPFATFQAAVTWAFERGEQRRR